MRWAAADFAAAFLCGGTRIPKRHSKSPYRRLCAMLHVLAPASILASSSGWYGDAGDESLAVLIVFGLERLGASARAP
jgi:hypothetical protein